MAEVVDEEEELAMWMPDCDDCDKPAEHICKTCGDKLCDGCKKDHQRKKKTRHHAVVQYSSGLKVPQKSTSTCPTHPGERYQLYCTPCQGAVCTQCIAQIHADTNHSFISIVDAFSEAKIKATANLEEMTQKIRPASIKYAEKVKESAIHSQTKIDETEEQMRRSAKLLHDEVDVILEDNLKQLQKIKEEKISPILQAEENKSESLRSKIEGAIKEYEENLRSDNPLDLIMLMKDRDSEDLEALFPVPSIEHVLLPRFHSGTIEKESMQCHFGSLTVTLRNEEEADISDQECRATECKRVETNDLLKNEKLETKMNTEECLEKHDKQIKLQMMVNPKLQVEFSLDKSKIKFFGLLRLFKSDRLLITVCGTKILLVDREGHLLHTINTGCQIYTNTGICVTKDDDVIFIDYNGCEVKKLHRDFTISKLFYTENFSPSVLWELKSGNLLVSPTEGKCRRVYDLTGKMVTEMKEDSLESPRNITVNTVNDDICLNDNYKKVVAFSSRGAKRFTYTGDFGVPWSSWFSSGSGLQPRDLCCDQFGNILITNCINNCVHIIDKDGHFLQYLVSGGKNIRLPYGIDVDKNGCAWVVEHESGKVKAFRYLQ